MRPGRRPSFTQKVAIAILIAATPLAPAVVSTGLAHRINVYARIEGDSILVEAHYGHRKKAQGASVEVFTSGGIKLLEGKTDQKGEFSFKIPEVTDLKIVIRDGMGHRNDFTIPADELRANQ